tara:strand:- start:712 stop:1116 length:405 start_codon:yes stop_codon:yes gene_type:complete
MTELLNKASPNPLARARGLGSAKDGVHHWWMQRVTAVLLVPLLIWFTISFLGEVASSNRLDVVNWFESPVHSFLLIALLTAALFHAQLGMRVIFEDYIHKNPYKMICLTLNQIIFPLAILISWVAILKLHIVGA